jgi:uncharacterized protein YdaU (DUF1376 family)
MPVYSGDYLRDTRHLSPLKHGIYFLLLMHCWDQRGPLPLDEQECAGIANCRSSDEIESLRYVLARFFIRLDDGFYNKRMQREVEKAANISNARSDAGRKGYEARAKQLPSKCQASASTPTTTTTTTTTTTSKDGAEAPDVWAFGLEVLTKESGLSERQARSYLGALLKTWSERTVLDSLMAATGKADPKAYARKWLEDKPEKGQKRRSAAEELMEEMNASQRPS